MKTESLKFKIIFSDVFTERKEIEMKKFLTVFAVIVVFTGVSFLPAYAGEKSRHRWQGIAIGVLLAPAINAMIAGGDSPSRYSSSPRYNYYTGYVGNDAGAQAAYLRGQAQELRRLQWARERRAYYEGRRSINPYIRGYRYGYYYPYYR
jgi:hypothetical protein